MISSKNSRPRTGRSNTWVRLTSIWAHLHLEDRQAVGEARGLLGGGERQRQPGQPAREERFDVQRVKPVADLVQRGRIGAVPEPVVQGGEADPPVAKLALGPLVPVEEGRA